MKSIKHKFNQLESLRGLLALAVTLIHIQFAVSILTNNFLIQGRTGGDWPVDFFFVLSGFVISYGYGNKINSKISFYTFIIKRFRRLYPLHLVILLIFVLIELARYLVEIKYPGTIIRPAFEESDSKAFISNLFLTQAFTGDINSFNGPSWSISVEFYTYFVFGLICLIFKKRLFLYIFLIILSLTKILLIENDLLFPREVFFFRCLYGFSLGAISYYFFNRFKISSFYAKCICTITILLFLYIMYFANLKIITTLPQLLFAISIFALLSINKNSILYKTLNNKLFIHLGKISYSIYMIHVIVWMVIGNFLRFFIGNHGEIVNGMRFMFWPWHISLLITFIALFLLVILSTFSYKFIELPFLKKNQNHND